MIKFDVTGKTSPHIAFVWTNEQGDVFLFPSWVVPLNEDGEVAYPEEENGLDRFNLQTCANVWKCTIDTELSLFDLAAFPHVKATVWHPNMSAQTEVWIIGGPLFDEVAAEQYGGPARKEN